MCKNVNIGMLKAIGMIGMAIRPSCLNVESAITFFISCSWLLEYLL